MRGPAATNAGHRRGPARVVDDADLRTGAHLLGQPLGAPLRGRPAGRLGHRDHEARGPGPGRQPGRVEIEHRSGVGAVAQRGVVAGDAVHGGHLRVGERRQLPFEGDAVAVPTVQARPHRDPAAPQQVRPVGRRELHPRAGVVADEDGVDVAREQVGAAQQHGRVEWRRRQVGDHQLAGGQRIEEGPRPGRRGRLACPDHRRGGDERARQVGVDLAPTRRRDTPTRPVDHVFRAGQGSTPPAVVPPAVVTAPHRRVRHVCSMTSTAELPGSRAS